MSGARKFSEYTNDRKVLLLDPCGEMKYLDLWWWKRVLSRIAPPQTISELWLAIYDWLTEWEEGWIFQKLYPLHYHAYCDWCHKRYDSDNITCRSCDRDFCYHCGDSGNALCKWCLYIQTVCKPSFGVARATGARRG
jgi:hypothetical protein